MAHVVTEIARPPLQHVDAIAVLDVATVLRIARKLMTGRAIAHARLWGPE